MGFLKTQQWYKRNLAKVYTRLIRGDFGALGDGTLIHPPFHSNCLRHVHIGKNCEIWSGWIDCIEEYFGVKYEPLLDIGDNVYIGFRIHLIACGHMRIGRDVVIADGVYISDNLHGYEDISRPILIQPVVHPGPVTIEDEVWLGEGVCVLPGVTIGKHSVIGSNSVVTRDIPPYSVAVGAPALVVKRLDPATNTWVRVEERGDR